MSDCPQYGFRPLLNGLAKTQSPAALYFVCSRHVRRYLRPFRETYTRLRVPQLSLLLLALGLAGFIGTYGAGTMVGRHLYSLLTGLPLALGAITLALLAIRYHIADVAVAMFAWGAVNSAIPVCCSTWLSKAISDEPESGGGSLVGCIQLSIMLGAAFGGLLLDHISVAATFVGGTFLPILANLTIGRLAQSVPQPVQRC